MPIVLPFDNFKTDINFPLISVINLAFPFLIKKTLSARNFSEDIISPVANLISLPKDLNMSNYFSLFLICFVILSIIDSHFLNIHQ